MSEQILSEYFSNTWKANYEKYKYTGYALAEHIADGEQILDVGCGFNLFKPIFKDSILGIDPYNDAADIKISLEDFNSDKIFDVVFCLGSVNFGSEANIKAQITKIKSHLKRGGRIYWRQNPGEADHSNDECKKIDFYKWSIEKNYDLANILGFAVIEAKWDTGNRIYSVWVKII